MSSYPNRDNQAELLAIGQNQIEIPYAKIDMTEEIRQLDGQLIACENVDHQWVFKKVRKERQHPNSIRTVDGRL